MCFLCLLMVCWPWRKCWKFCGGGNNFLIFREKSAQSSKQESGSLTIEANFQDVGDNLGVSGWREMSETHWLLNVVWIGGTLYSGVRNYYFRESIVWSDVCARHECVYWIRRRTTRINYWHWIISLPLLFEI